MLELQHVIEHRFRNVPQQDIDQSIPLVRKGARFIKPKTGESYVIVDVWDSPPVTSVSTECQFDIYGHPTGPLTLVRSTRYFACMIATEELKPVN